MRSRILVVDDSVASARQLTGMVEGLGGYEVVGHARNGAEAVKLYKSVQPDVVLMDIVMPMMDGIQSLRTLLRLDPEAQVVMISSMGGVGGKVEEAMRLGAKSVISKPYEVEKISAVLARLAGGKQEG